MANNFATPEELKELERGIQKKMCVIEDMTDEEFSKHIEVSASNLKAEPTKYVTAYDLSGRIYRTTLEEFLLRTGRNDNTK